MTLYQRYKQARQAYMDSPTRASLRVYLIYKARYTKRWDERLAKGADVTHLQEAILSDGSIVRGQPEHVARAVAIDRDMCAVERAWVDQLRAEGIKAAHPDDGWVKRAENKVHLCYPQFNDGLGVADLLALGTPEKWRVVRVVGSSDLLLRTPDTPSPFYWHFEERS